MFRKNYIYMVIILIFFIFIGFLPQQIFGQTGSYFNQRDDQYRLLGLKRAREVYESAKAEYERSKEMLERELISQQELERVKSIYVDAEVNYQQSLLAVLFEKQYVVVKKALKYQAKDGYKHVRLTLANTSGGGADYKTLLNIDDDLFKSLQPEVIHDVYVSLQNDDGAIISQPYEAKIEKLRYGKPVMLDFALLQDLDAVTVSMIYGNGSQRNAKIFLQKDASENKVIVQSEQFAQEVELGSEATFDLTLELFSGTNNTFNLVAVNLPPQINRYFIDPASNARLSRFKFTERTNTRRAGLKIFLPDRPFEQIEIDKPIPFYVLVFPQKMAGNLKDLHKKKWTQQELEKLNIGFVRLELVPRGIGRLLVRAPQLFYSIKEDEKAEIVFDVINEGSRSLNNVEIEVDLPLQWRKELQPQMISNLNIKEEKRVKLTLLPPEDVSAGRYEFRIRTSSLSDDQPVNGEDKTITVEVESKANIAGTSLIILLMLSIIIGIVIFGVKLSKR